MASVLHNWLNQAQENTRYDSVAAKYGLVVDTPSGMSQTGQNALRFLRSLSEHSPTFFEDQARLLSPTTPDLLVSPTGQRPSGKATFPLRPTLLPARTGTNRVTPNLKITPRLYFPVLGRPTLGLSHNRLNSSLPRPNSSRRSSRCSSWAETRTVRGCRRSCTALCARGLLPPRARQTAKGGSLRSFSWIYCTWTGSASYLPRSVVTVFCYTHVVCTYSSSLFIYGAPTLESINRGASRPTNSIQPLRAGVSIYLTHIRPRICSQDHNSLPTSQNPN
ncbi:hypothetical protein RSAG8_06865, partial [Rhizoctonia solani AG-8 WAC10335]